MMNCQNYNNYYGRNPQMYGSMFSCTGDLEGMYPDVYRVVYPMVCHTCDNVRTPVTEEMMDRMTDDIYDRAEADGRIHMDAWTDCRNAYQEDIQENRQMPRRRNRFLRDLIRILIIRELLRRR